MTNKAIGRILNVAANTVKNALTGLRKMGLIITTKPQSPHRRIYPNCRNLLDLLRSQVDETYSTDLVPLLDRLGSRLLDLPEKSTEGKKKKKKDFAPSACPCGDKTAQAKIANQIAASFTHDATEVEVEALIAEVAL